MGDYMIVRELLSVGADSAPAIGAPERATLDYASLQLVNEQGDLLGRSARVGGGMILFDLGLVG